MDDFERAFDNTEKVAEAARKSAGKVVSQARTLEKAARTGKIAGTTGIKGCQEKLREALAALQEEVARAVSCWPFSDEEEQEWFRSRYVAALQAAADERGLKIYERDGSLISYPSIVRVLPTERAVRVDKKKVSATRPSWLVDLLLANQKKSSGFSSQRFLESLYAVYVDIAGGGGADLLQTSGPVVHLARIYKLMTSLPGVSRDYGRSDFARDLYVLDLNGPRRTRKGAAVSFPASTGARRRAGNLFTFIGPDGSSAEYYGIRFSGDGG